MPKDIKRLSELNPKLYLLGALGYTALITFLSLYSLEDLPRVETFEFSDKFAHGLAYFVFTIIWFITLFKLNSKYPLMWAFVVTFFYGGLMEILQAVLSTARLADIYDLMANTIGAILAIAVVVLLNKRVKNQK